MPDWFPRYLYVIRDVPVKSIEVPCVDRALSGAEFKTTAFEHLKAAFYGCEVSKSCYTNDKVADLTFQKFFNIKNGYLPETTQYNREYFSVFKDGKPISTLFLRKNKGFPYIEAKNYESGAVETISVLTPSFIYYTEILVLESNFDERLVFDDELKSVYKSTPHLLSAANYCALYLVDTFYTSNILLAFSLRQFDWDKAGADGIHPRRVGVTCTSSFALDESDNTFDLYCWDTQSGGNPLRDLLNHKFEVDNINTFRFSAFKVVDKIMPNIGGTYVSPAHYLNNNFENKTKLKLLLEYYKDISFDLENFVL